MEDMFIAWDIGAMVIVVQIHMKKRNRLDPKRLNGLVFI